ncbi:MAG: hypothetical protein ACP5II_06120 [Infirmifilum sp.]|jgi:hypothetical protein|uniref:Uncharacterized protein n=1 Tax=Infirmifilum uzonense TaxID=1550241 RepID=A0A0F7CKY3_9CREN|nr:hypothetical protein [Infirmifilum uzonense]AKG38461.1 hypothetical protein MA03_03065 [Infirmifilum uzonense]
MGRVNYSFTPRLREEVHRIRRDLWQLLSAEERLALERLESRWIGRSHLIESLSTPYLLGAMLLVALLDIEARLERVEAELARLESGTHGKE